MSVFENLAGSMSGMLGQAEAAAVPMLISAVFARGNMGGLGGIVSQLQQGGLGAQVSSWLGNGTNQPVSPDQIQSALGSDQVKQIAQHLGLPVDKALALLSQHLPGMVDQASPNGELAPAA